MCTIHGHIHLPWHLTNQAGHIWGYKDECGVIPTLEKFTGMWGIQLSIFKRFYNVINSLKSHKVLQEQRGEKKKFPALQGQGSHGRFLRWISIGGSTLPGFCSSKVSLLGRIRCALEIPLPSWFFLTPLPHSSPNCSHCLHFPHSLFS